MAQQTFEELVAAVKQAESRGKRYNTEGKLTTSAKGALGEMQVMPKTVTDPGFGVTPAKDKSPDEIARVGRDYLQAMKQRYGDTEKALIAYNWGPGSTDKWIASGAKPEALPQETKSYIERVKGLLGGKTQVAKTAAEPTPAEEMMTKALPAGTTAKAPDVPRETMMAKMDVKSMPASYQAAFALAALADAQDEEDDKAYDENKGTETEKFFAEHKPVNHLASLDLSVQPVMMAEGGDPKSAKSLMEKFKDLAAEYGRDPVAFMRERKIPTSPMGQALTAGYETYKHVTGKDPLLNLQKELNQRLNPEIDTGDTESISIEVGLPRIRRADGSPEEGEEASKPFFGNPNISRQAGQARRNAAIQKASFRDELADAKDTARKGDAYQEMERYLQSRDAVPDIKVTGYLPEETHGLFSSDRTNMGTGTIKVNKNVHETYMPSTIAHEMTHAADRQMMIQAKEQGMFGKSNQFTDAYEKMVGPEGRNRTQLLRKRYPEFEEDNRYYRSRPDEVAAHAIGAYSGPVLQDRAPRHVDATAATEFQILMDLAQRHADQGPKGLEKIPAFFKKMGRYADGGEVGNLTPQQIERIAAQEAADRDAASTAAFIAQKSGIGRKEGNISKALKSGEGQVEMAKGLTMMPQNIMGAPVDIATMAMRPFGYDVEKPVMGSEWLKEKTRDAGLAFKPSDDPTLAGFFEAGNIASGMFNPAGVTRAGVQAAEKTGEAAKMLARDFQQYNQNLAVPGASYAVRNKGTPVVMAGFHPGKGTVDEAERVVRSVTKDGETILEAKDKPLSDWFSKTVSRYLRSDFASPQDQLVRAAEEGKILHVAPKQFSDSAEDFNLQHFLQRRQSDLEYMRQAEGFGKSNMATTPYGQRIEDITDISAYPEMLGDLTPNRVPPSLRNLVEKRPETRVTDFAPNIVENLKLDQLRDKMLEVRQSDGTYGAYGQPKVKVPSEFLLPDDTLSKLNVAAASNRMARYERWQDDTRQKMATTALRADPAFPRAQLQDGKFIGVALPDIKKNPEMTQLVTDIGCDGGWCTRYTPNAEAYASNFSRLHVIVTGEGKQARPVAQIAIADSGPSYDTKRFSITEVKEKGNTADFANNPALPAIQQYIQYLDKTYGGLDYVDNLKGLRLTALPEYPMQVLDLFNPTTQQRRMLEKTYGSEENGFRAVRDKAVQLNNGSRFIAGNEDNVANILEQALNTVAGPKETLARRIQMNLFGLPPEKATGGMIERQHSDNRRYL